MVRAEHTTEQRWVDMDVTGSGGEQKKGERRKGEANRCSPIHHRTRENVNNGLLEDRKQPYPSIIDLLPIYSVCTRSHCNRIGTGDGGADPLLDAVPRKYPVPVNNNNTLRRTGTDRRASAVLLEWVFGTYRVLLVYLCTSTSGTREIRRLDTITSPASRCC